MAHFVLPQPTDEGLKFSPKTVEDLKKKIFDITSSFPERETPRVLFIGESGAGKSSFISSIISTFNGAITMTSTIGSRVGYEYNNTRRFFEYQIHEKDERGRTLNLILCDSRGISKDGQLGISELEIPLLIEGRFLHGDKFQDDCDAVEDSVTAQREPIEPSCIVFLEKAVLIGDVHDSIKHKLNIARNLIREKGMLSCLVITHIDEVEPNLKNVLGSKKVAKLIKERAGEAGVTPNRVFVVKNYTDERRTHIKHDVLILRTVLSIVNDVKQRLRDKSVQKQPAPSVTSPSVISGNRSTVHRHSTDSSRTMSDLSPTPTIMRPNPASRRIIPESEVVQSRISAMSTRSQLSGTYEVMGLLQVIGRYVQNMSIQNSQFNHQGNAGDILYEEPIRHSQPHSSDEEQEPRDVQRNVRERRRTISGNEKQSMTFHIPEEDS